MFISDYHCLYNTNVVPAIGDVVLSRFNNGDEYFRGFVKDFASEQSDDYVTVEFIDLGGEEVIHVRDLIIPTTKIVNVKLHFENKSFNLI